MKSAVASSLAGLVLAACLAEAAGAASLDARYDVSLLGITLGTASLTGGIDGSGYKLDIAAKLTGIVGGVTGGRGSGAAMRSASAEASSGWVCERTSASTRER